MLDSVVKFTYSLGFIVFASRDSVNVWFKKPFILIMIIRSNVMDLQQRIESQAMSSLDKASLDALDQLYFQDIEIADRTNFDDADENLIDVLEAMHPTFSKH